MAKPFVISVPHSLGKEEALRRLKAGMARVTGEIPLVKVEDQSWIGTQMSFRIRALGQVSTGTVDVEDDTVRVEVSLPLLLQKFASAIEGSLSQGTKRLLEKR